VSRPFQIDSNLVYAAAQGNQSVHASAFDGENYFVVWTDDREGSSGIYGARVEPSGVVLDPTGIVISADGTNESDPDVAFDGTNYFVVWCHRDDTSYDDIHGARVSRQGKLLDVLGLPICVRERNQRKPAIAFDGENHLVVWEDFRLDYRGDILGARVSPSGVVLDRGGFAISTSGSRQYLPDIAFDGTNYLVVWERRPTWEWRGDIHGKRVTTSAAVIDGDVIVISESEDAEMRPAVAFNGENYMVAWESGVYADHGEHLYGARVSRSGAVLDTSGISLPAATEDFNNPEVVPNGSGYMILWHGQRGTSPDIYGARVDASGVVLDPEGIALCTEEDSQVRPTVASDGAGHMVFWDDQRNDHIDVYAARVDSSGSVIDGNGGLVSLAANYQVLPAIGSNGDNFLVVWEDGMSGTSEIRGSLVDPWYMVMNKTSTPISRGAGDRGNPAIASDGEDYMVVWADERAGTPAVYGARVSPTGKVTDRDGIPISLNAISAKAPDIAFDGTNYMVVWQEIYDGDPGIFAGLIDGSGNLLEPNRIPVAVEEGDQSDPAIAYDGRNYLIAWIDGSSGICCARVAPNGTVLDKEGILISSGETEKKHPDVAFDGLRYTVVWEGDRGGKINVYSARVHPAGIVVDDEPISLTTGYGRRVRPAIAFADSEYVAVRQGDEGDHTSVYWARLEPISGIVIDPGWIGISDGAGAASSPAVAVGTPGRILVAYSNFIPPGAYGSTRIFANMLIVPNDGSRVGIAISPNPFRTTANIGFRLPAGTLVRLTIHDVAGRLIKTVTRGYRGPGRHNETWDGTDEEGRPLSDGVYFARVQSKYGMASGKCVLVR
jgi:hypothetical protein